MRKHIEEQKQQVYIFSGESEDTGDNDTPTPFIKVKDNHPREQMRSKFNDMVKTKLDLNTNNQPHLLKEHKLMLGSSEVADKARHDYDGATARQQAQQARPQEQKDFEGLFVAEDIVQEDQLEMPEEDEFCLPDQPAAIEEQAVEKVEPTRGPQRRQTKQLTINSQTTKKDTYVGFTQAQPALQTEEPRKEQRQEDLEVQLDNSSLKPLDERLNRCSSAERRSSVDASSSGKMDFKKKHKSTLSDVFRKATEKRSAGYKQMKQKQGAGRLNPIDDDHDEQNTGAFLTPKNDKCEEIISGLMLRHDSENMLQISNKNALLTSPLPPGIILSCKLKRNKGFMGVLSTEYDFFVGNGLKHLVSAQKKVLSNSEVFAISNQLGKYDRQHIVCSLKANVLHNQYQIMGREQGSEVKVRFMYATVSYGRFFKQKEDREMRVSVPYGVTVAVRTDHLNAFTFDSIDQKIRLSLQKKRSIGKSSNSIKDFELVDSQDDDYHYLSFKKESENVFNIQIQHPLTPLQAFAVVLTRFDAQLK